MVANLKYAENVLRNIQSDPGFEDYSFVPPNLESDKTQFEILRREIVADPGKKLLVLDLDETLIHVSKTTENSNFTIPIKLKNGSIVRVSFEQKLF